MTMRISPKEIKEAYAKIKEDIIKTPLEYSPKLSKISGGRVFLKMEHLQHTDSFKIRSRKSQADEEKDELLKSIIH